MATEPDFLEQKLLVFWVHPAKMLILRSFSTPMSEQESPDAQPKWDYTSSRQNLITGALVVGGNLLIVMIYLLYRTVPAVHQLISGKPL